MIWTANSSQIPFFGDSKKKSVISALFSVTDTHLENLEMKDNEDQSAGSMSGSCYLKLYDNSRKTGVS